MEITLRDYQQEAIDAINQNEKDGQFLQGIQLPTGTGKSIIQALMLKDKIARGDTVGLIVPWEHLIDNAVDTLSLVYPREDIGIIRAEDHQSDKQIQVCSISTIARENRRADLLEKYQTTVVDEMHYFMAPTWRKAIDAIKHPEGLRVGFSATIGRKDRRGLAAMFGKITYTKTLLQMIADGWLCPLKGYRLDIDVDFESLKSGKGKGDFDDEELAEVIGQDDKIKLIYDAWVDYAKDRVTMVFTPTVAIAVMMCEYWEKQGVPSTWVSGAIDREEAKERIADFREGRAQCMFNCAKLAVGFNHRPIGCILMARPTRSQTFYIQCIGRGTRTCQDALYTDLTIPIADRVAPTKEDCIILDLGGNGDRVGGLQQFPDIFDLPDTAVKDLAKQMSDSEETTTDDILTKYYHTKGKVLVTPMELFNNSSMSWVKNAFGGWSIGMGKLGTIFLDRMMDGYTLRLLEERAMDELNPKTGRVQMERIETPLVNSPLEIDLAMSLAENEVLRRVKAAKNEGDHFSALLVDKNASWRKKPISEKQFDMLRYMGQLKPFSNYIEYMNNSFVMSCGEACDKISELKANRTFNRGKTY